MKVPVKKLQKIKKSHDGFNFSENSASNSKKETLTDSKTHITDQKLLML